MDKRALEAELAGAVEAEAAAARVNEVKKRAIGTSGSYDEFKARVACAHMKPLSKEDVAALSSMAKPFSRTGVASGGVCGPSGFLSVLPSAGGARADATAAAVAKLSISSSAAGTGAGSAASALASRIRTAPELEREWRRRGSNEEKHRLLRELGLPALRSLFKSEVDSDLLGSILRVLDARVHDMQAAAAHVSTAGAMASHSCADSSGAQSDSSGGPAADAAAFGVSVALLLSKGGMFDLARDFLTKDDLAAVSRIAAAAVDLNAAVASDVSSLRAAYRAL